MRLDRKSYRDSCILEIKSRKKSLKLHESLIVSSKGGKYYRQKSTFSVVYDLMGRTLVLLE